MPFTDTVRVAHNDIIENNSFGSGFPPGIVR